MAVIARESEDIGKVFDDLCLSRKVMKRAEGTQTPPLKEVSVPGEVPDDCVSSLIDMLTPSLRHHSSRTNSKDDSSEWTPLLTEVEEISVDRTSSKKTKKVKMKEGSSVEVKEVFEELCLSRKKTSLAMVNDPHSSEAKEKKQVEGLPDGSISSMIEMLSPSIRQLHNKNGISVRTEKSEKVSEPTEKVLRAYQSVPNVAAPQPNSSVSTTLSEVSLDSIFTTPSNMTDAIDENVIKTLLSSQQVEKGFVETGSNTESSNRNSKRKNKKKRKKSRVKIIKDSGTDTIYQTEDSTNQTDEIISKESDDVEKDGNKPLEIKEQCHLSIDLESSSSKDIRVNNGITVLRNRTDWTDTPFLPQDSSDTVEESTTSNVDSEPTRGCPSAFQVIKDIADKSSSNPKTEIKRFKAILHPSKRQPGNKEYENDHKQDLECSNFFNKPITNTCTVSSPFGIKRLDNKFQDRMFPSHSTLSSPENSTGTSLTSIRTYSCSSCNGEDKLGNCCCNTFLGDSHNAPGEPKVFWAITKINVYPDDSRTYEVMPLTGKKPAELPEKSDSVFVLIPPKPGHVVVPSNLE